ncbi:uncharacterized protein [Linepithema humile]|uniref:uncharacterized protein n=1 Tax=Linepithema humile TaxID=83485 RepID=UPI00351E18DC
MPNVSKFQAQPRHAENDVQYWKFQERLETIEAQLKKLNINVEQILKCVQDRDRRRVTKVSCLPLSTEKDVQDFKNVNDETYKEVVNFNVKTHRFLMNKLV